MNRLRQCWHYARKVFDLPERLAAVGDHRCWPQVPTPAVTASLWLGALLRVPSFLQLQAETARPGWQRLLGLDGPLSDDLLGYVSERYRLEDLRAVLVANNQTLKRNKAFESAKISGLLVVALDANEQFASRCRCCAQCSQRQIKIVGADGQTVEVTEYYHRQVYAQLHGPDLSVVLDLEPIRPGEEECAAALRLLGRMRRLYGPRFFDAITVDAWYANGPFIKAVQKLGWGVVVVLKQERYEVYQEASALAEEQTSERWTWEERNVCARQVRDLPFTDAAIGPVRVVLADETWEETQRVAGRKRVVPQQSHWRWLATRELDGYGLQTIWRIGHQRWGVENHAFNELTQHYHLEHCPHHEPVALVAWLLILVGAFNLFKAFARLNGVLWGAGRVTLQEMARQLDRGLERWEDLDPLWSG